MLKSRRARRAAATRGAIVAAALRLFARQGFRATTVEDITQAADVGKGTFFNYFPSKEHLLTGFGDSQLERIHKALEVAQMGGVPIQQVVWQLVVSLTEIPGRSPDLVRSFLLVVVSPGKVGPLMRRKLLQGRAWLGELIRLGQRRGEVRRDLEAGAVARHLQQVFLGGLLLWTLHPATTLARWVRPTFELFWRSVAAPRQRGKRKRGA
jgi:AcrR family transcriptional regulator